MQITVNAFALYTIFLDSKFCIKNIKKWFYCKSQEININDIPSATFPDNSAYANSTIPEIKSKLYIKSNQ